MAHEWKFGDWASSSAGIVRFVALVPKKRTKMHFVSVGGDLHYFDERDVRYLSDCTGFDWKPPKPIEPPEGYRLLTEGEVIRHGDMWFGDEWAVLNRKTNAIGGEWNPSDHYPMARKIEKYRPFANAAEFAPHRDKWLIDEDGDQVLIVRVRGDGHGLATLYGTISFKDAFVRFKFEDGSPFGVKE